MIQQTKADILKALIEAESKHNNFLVFFKPLFDWEQYLTTEVITDDQAKNKANEILIAITKKRDSFINNYQFSYLKADRSLSELRRVVFFAMELLNSLTELIKDFDKYDSESKTGIITQCKNILQSLDARVPELLGNEFNDFDGIDEIASDIAIHTRAMDYRLSDLHDDLASFDASILLFNDMIEHLSDVINQL